MVLRHQNLYKAAQIVHHKGWYPDIRTFIWLLKLSTRAKPNVLNVFKQFRNSTRAGSQASKSLKGSLNGPHETQAYKSSQSAATKASKHLQGWVLSFVTLCISRIYRFIGTKKNFKICCWPATLWLSEIQGEVTWNENFHGQKKQS